jgi:quinoprotein glucose dehydrogenase
MSWMILFALWVTPVSAQHGTTKGEWTSYSADVGSTRYSPLDQINKENVGELEVLWRWQAGTYGSTPEFNYRITPLMVDGVLYVTAGNRRTVVALDAATGEPLWMYRLDEGERGLMAPRRNSGRGLAYWTDGEGDERIVLITPGYRMVGLDAKTGAPIPQFGVKGIVDLYEELDYPVEGDGDLGSSTPAIIANDVIVVGTAMPAGGSPPTKEMPPGHIRGYDVRTGKQRWIFHTIPQPGEFGNETWENDSWQYTGNTGVWINMSADEELGYIYLPVETPTGDYYGGHRPGDNLFAESLVCLDINTGKRVWHHQLVHHGIWDYDNTAAPILIDITVDGKPIKAVALVTKQAFTFVFDRVTGEPVWPIEEREVPSSDVPGEITSPTQPFPTKPAPFDRQGVSVDDLIDFTPELHAEAIEISKKYRLGPIFTPPSLFDPDGTQGTLLMPGVVGGANWNSAAADPETGILYVGSSTFPTIIALDSDPELSNMRYIRVMGRRMPRGGGPQGLPLIKPPWGRITAIDLNTGEHVWMMPNGDTPEYVKNHPALEGLEIPRTGKADRSGVMVTKTLVFAGEGGGMYSAGYAAGGPMLYAYDKLTGEIAAEIELPANQSGVPMTYMVKMEEDALEEDEPIHYEPIYKQIIVVAVGARNHVAELVALALP